MRKHVLIGFIFFLCGIVGAAAQTPKASSVRELTRQSQLLLKWWVGDWDNMEQIYFDTRWREQKTPAQRTHRRVHARVSLLPEATLGAPAVFVETFLDDNAATPYRRRVYVLSTRLESGEILLSASDVRPGPASVRDIARGDLTRLPGCDLAAALEGGQFHARVSRSCIAVAGVEADEMLISPDRYWFRDVVIDKKGQLTTAFGGSHVLDDAWHDLRKARIFACEVFVATRSAARLSETSYAKLAELTLHDQGGEASFETASSRRYVLKLRNNLHSYQNDRDTMTLYLGLGNIEDGLVHTQWATPGSDRIGFISRRGQIHCNLAASPGGP